MPLCPECDEKVSSQAKTCPHCDADLRKGPKRSKSSGNKSSGNKTLIYVIIAIVVGGLFMMGIVLTALILPAVQQAREAARRSVCKNNLTEIGIALHNYAEVYQVFPPAYTVDANGKPLHSWRVLILPFLGQRALYDQIDLNEPWDSPKNSQFHNVLIPSFQCPSHAGSAPGATYYLGIVGDQCFLRPGTGVRMRDCRDGLSNIMVVSESNMTVNWMEPRDIAFENLTRVGDPNGISGPHHPGSTGHILLGDGTVRFMANPQGLDLKALATINGGEIIPPQ